MFFASTQNNRILIKLLKFEGKTKICQMLSWLIISQQQQKNKTNKTD